MEQHSHRARLTNAFHYLFRRLHHTSTANDQVNSPLEVAGVLGSSLPIDMNQDPGVTSLPGQAASHALDEDVEMLLANPSDSTHFTIPNPSQPAADSSQPSSLPMAGGVAVPPFPFDLGDPYPSMTNNDAHSVSSMPPLFDGSDSESDGGYLHHGVYDFMSESEADAQDVEMTLLVDDGDFSDPEDAVWPQSVPSAATEDSRARRHVTVQEVEDDAQQHPHTIPLTSNEQASSSMRTEPHPHGHPHPLPQIHPHPHVLHPPFQPHPHLHLHPLQLQQPFGGVHLPTFPGMPGLRAQGQVEGQGPLPGLRTLFQPLVVEAVAQAGERLRTAQATGLPAAGQGLAFGPVPGPDTPLQGANRTGVPILQVMFDVPMFRIPAETQPGQTEVPLGDSAQRPADQTFEHERVFAAPTHPLRADNPNPAIPHLNPEAFVPNPNLNAADAMPAPLRQLFEALDLHPDAPEPPPGDGDGDDPQNGAPPAWTGLLGLLFGLGLGASPELNREDPARAKRLVKGLEAVNTGLVKRMRKINQGNAGGAVCAICWDALLDEEGDETRLDSAAGVPVWNTTSDQGQAADPESSATEPAEPEEPLPKVIALPCSHVFHSTCLVPWFSRPKQTTCPTCRFNVDPDNLTYEPPSLPQSDHRQPQQQQQQQPTSPHPVAPQQEQQGQHEPFSGGVPPLNQAAQPQDGHAAHPGVRRTILEHTFTIPFPLPPFLQHPQPPNPDRPQAETRQQGPAPPVPFPMPPGATDPFPPMVFQRALHTLRQFSPPTQHRPPTAPNGVPTPTPPFSQQTQPRPPMQGPGLQPPPQDGPRNPNGIPRFPGLFHFELPQIVRMPDGTWFWSAPDGNFPSPTAATSAGPQVPRPPAPKRTWAPPPPPGPTLRQRVEQGEREQGLRCDDMSCGLGPSDDDPEPTADLARVIIHSTPGDAVSGCTHAFHPACLVSAERVAGWGSGDERERAGGLVEVSCPICRAVGTVPREDWEKGALALT